jgi:hypothetical protein
MSLKAKLEMLANTVSFTYPNQKNRYILIPHTNDFTRGLKWECLAQLKC